jgi:hypothetical protein
MNIKNKEETKWKYKKTLLAFAFQLSKALYEIREGQSATSVQGTAGCGLAEWAPPGRQTIPACIIRDGKFDRTAPRHEQDP